jgi:ATP-dependent Clp protease ATP-binding subunit ClpX
MVADLLLRANHDVQEAQRGIIFIDEVDKIARRSQGAKTGAGSRDIGGEGVQQAMLKLLEGREIFVPLNVTQHWSKHDFVQVDTGDILFVCAGTFSDLHGYVGEKSVGFGRCEGDGRRLKRIHHKELIEYGMLAEFVGRLPVAVQLGELDHDELLQVLTVPPDSIIREYRELLAADDIDLRFDEGALRAIVGYAIDKKVGARALRGIVEEVMGELMFDAPERRGEAIEIDGRYVTDRLARLDEGILLDL